MAEQTTNYGLVKPGPDEFYDVSVPNGNMDIIDTKLKEIENKGDITQQERSKWNGGFLAKSNTFISGPEVNFDLLEANKSYKVGEATGLNAPPVGYGVLNYYFPEQGYAIQEFTTMVGDIKYTRRYDTGASGGEWSAWKQATFSQSTITRWNNGAEVASRFTPHALTITNWNFATKNGIYMGLNVPNAPGPEWHMGEVIAHNDDWLIQKVVRFGANEANGKQFERMRINGVWESWRETSNNVVYDKAHLGGGAYPDPDTWLDRAFITNHAKAQNPGEVAHFWYIEQIFYAGSNGINSRSQFARSYATPASDMKVRHFYNGIWTPWSPSIQQLFTSVSNGKSALASAISDRGVYTSPVETFANMANNIRLIGGGAGTMKYAYGSVPNVQIVMDVPAGTFGFTPRVIITRAITLTRSFLTVYSPISGMYSGSGGFGEVTSTERSGGTDYNDEAFASFTNRNGGFRLNAAPTNAYPYPGITMEWFAFG